MNVCRCAYCKRVLGVRSLYENALEAARTFCAFRPFSTRVDLSSLFINRANSEFGHQSEKLTFRRTNQTNPKKNK